MNNEISFSVHFENNRKLIEEELKKALEKCLYAIGVTSVAKVVEYMSKPDFTGKDIVDTGRLRASISFITPERESGPNSTEATIADTLTGRSPELTVYIGSNVEYADYVNNGTSKQPARQFLQNGINLAYPEFEKLIEEILKGDI